jgi:hypothetical protein
VTVGMLEMPDELKIAKMTEEERRNTANELIAYLRSRLRPDAKRAQEIYDHWAQKKSWTTVEATIIGIGLNPDALDAIQYMRPEDALRFHRLLDLLQNNFENDRVGPAELVKWGRDHKKAIDQELVSEIEKRLQRKPRPVGTSQKEKTVAKMVVAMARARYKFGKNTKNAVAQSIKDDFDSIGSGMTLSKGAILSALDEALSELDPVRQVVERLDQEKISN